MAYGFEATRTPARSISAQDYRRQPRRHVWAGVALALIGCTESAEPPAAACPDVSGNYAATFTRLDGSCDAKVDGDGKGTISFSKAADGTVSMVYPGIDGACPGTLDASCRFLATCKAVAKDGSVIATASVDYKFTATGFSGSNAAGIQPPLVPTGCTATYKQTGNKL